MKCYSKKARQSKAKVIAKDYLAKVDEMREAIAKLPEDRQVQCNKTLEENIKKAKKILKSLGEGIDEQKQESLQRQM